MPRRTHTEQLTKRQRQRDGRKKESRRDKDAHRNSRSR